MSTGPVVHDLQSVQTRRRERADPEAPLVTLTARVAFPGTGDVRVAVRPVVAVLADASGGLPRMEVHVEGGSSVVLEGEALAVVLGESAAFLRDPASGADREHGSTDGLCASFDIAMSPFVVLDQPALRVAGARTFMHPSGAVALRLVGVSRPRALGPEHVAREGEAAEREAFDLQLQSRRGEWLASLLDEALRNLAPPEFDVSA